MIFGIGNVWCTCANCFNDELFGELFNDELFGELFNDELLELFKGNIKTFDLSQQIINYTPPVYKVVICVIFDKHFGIL